MRTALLFAMLVPALALSACNKGADAGNAAGAAKALPAVPAPKGTSWSETVNPTTAGGFTMGNPGAALKVIEYGSYTCPHCKAFAQESDELLKKVVDTGKVSFEFRSFVRDPLDMTMALIARCGGKDSFFPMKHEFYANQDAIFAGLQAKGDAAYQGAMKATPDKRFVALAELAGLIDFAKARGLPEPAVRACLADFKTAETIAKGNDTATKQFNVQGTPTLIINGTPQENVATWPQLQAKLQAAGA